MNLETQEKIDLIRAHTERILLATGIAPRAADFSWARIIIEKAERIIELARAL